MLSWSSTARVIAIFLASAAVARTADPASAAPTQESATCAPLGASLNILDPVALFGRVLECQAASQTEQAAMYFDLARLYGQFDSKRVADPSAHQVVSVLTMQVVDVLGDAGIKAVGEAQQHLHTDQAALAAECSVLRKVGPPAYEPTYMTGHGVRSFLGSPSKAQKMDVMRARSEWDAILDRFCEMASLARNGMGASRFSVEDGVAWMNWPGGRKRIEGVQLDSFELVEGDYARDAQHVFYGERMLEGADPATFRVLGERLGVDAKRAYFESKACAVCDRDSIRQAGPDWFVDAKHVFRETEGQLAPFDDASAPNFTVINDYFAKDDRSVFLFDRKILGADAPSFALAKCGSCLICGEDKNRCYWFDNPTACDCAAHTGDDFVIPTMQVPSRGGIVFDGRFSVDSGFESLPADLRIDYRALAAGTHALPVTCWNFSTGKTESLLVPIRVEDGGFYALEEADGSQCVPVIRRPVLVLGRSDDPQLSLKIGDELLPEAQISADTRSITVACYRLAKKKEFRTEVQVPVRLKAGTIYRLRGTYDTTANRCEVTAEPRGVASG